MNTTTEEKEIMDHINKNKGIKLEVGLSNVVGSSAQLLFSRMGAVCDRMDAICERVNDTNKQIEALQDTIKKQSESTDRLARMALGTNIVLTVATIVGAIATAVGVFATLLSLK